MFNRLAGRLQLGLMTLFQHTARALFDSSLLNYFPFPFGMMPGPWCFWWGSKCTELTITWHLQTADHWLKRRDAQEPKNLPDFLKTGSMYLLYNVTVLYSSSDLTCRMRAAVQITLWSICESVWRKSSTGVFLWFKGVSRKYALGAPYRLKYSSRTWILLLAAAGLSSASPTVLYIPPVHCQPSSGSCTYSSCRCRSGTASSSQETSTPTDVSFAKVPQLGRVSSFSRLAQPWTISLSYSHKTFFIFFSGYCFNTLCWQKR